MNARSNDVLHRLGDTMYTKEKLLSDLSNMSIDPKGTSLIHSSLKSVGEVEGGADTILDALCEYMEKGLLIFPTHSWKWIKKDAENPVFDIRTTPSCVGALGNIFMKRKNVIRSMHPTHSVAAIGKDAAEYTSGEERKNTPCPRDGCWGKLYDRKATILFLGCTLRSNTFIHCIEEVNKISDRISSDTYKIKIIDSNGIESYTDMYGHHSTCNDVSENYIKLEKPFLELGAIHYGYFGDARCVIGNAQMMADITTDILKQQPNIFSDDREIAEELYIKQ